MDHLPVGQQARTTAVTAPPIRAASYSIKAWNRAAFAKDPYGRNMWGVPPQGRADYAFFQHIAKSLDSEVGRAAILFPHGVLFRREEAVLREALVKSDLVECILGLGEGLFYNSPMPATVVILRSRKQLERQGKVLFIDASQEVAREQSQSFLHAIHQGRILDTYRAFVDDKGFATVTTIDEIGAHSYNLAISLYVESRHESANAKQVNVIEALADWRAAAPASDAAIQAVIALLREEVSA